MCIGSMSLPNTDAAIPGSIPARRAQLPSEDPARTTQSSTVPSSSRTATSVRTGVSGGGFTAAGTGPSSLASGPGNAFIPDDLEKGLDDGERNKQKGGGTKRITFPGQDDESGEGGTGRGDDMGIDDDGGVDDKRIVDDEGDPTDDTKDKLKEREIEDEGPTTSPHRIVSPLIRAVQGERTINRRGRNSLFVDQGRRTGAHRVDGRIVNSTTPSQTFVSPVDFGLIPLRR